MIFKIFNSDLRDLPIPNIRETILEKPLRILKEISEKNGSAGETPQFRNRKEELIQRLKRRKITGQTFEQSTDVVGRERLLLSIYLEYLGRKDAKDWLPDFDKPVAESILGNSGQDWHSARRRQVTLLFFNHFGRFHAPSFLCARLLEAYNSADATDPNDVRTWSVSRGTIFHPSGPENISKQASEKVQFEQLMERYAIPKEGRFAEKLRQFVFLERMKAVPFGGVTPVFDEIERFRNEHISSQFLLGSKALQIMVQRVEGEGAGKWPKEWSERIVRFGCDPRQGRASAEVTKWWGWATDSELRLAQQGMIGLDLGFFIEFLRNSLSGTGKEEQFKFRASLLMWLFETGKIIQARLVLNHADFHKLDPKYRNAAYGAARLVGTTDQTSIICLHCRDDIHIIEGTHNFGLRVFHPNFPVSGFWDSPSKEYSDKELRISPKDCPIFIRHTHTGSWIENFFPELRSVFHIEWE
ncbi:MAG: hypothetical protein BWK80_62660 [Desulfobacteraceae bacterium IS3]|nr:MAG: hypothetical protein BWK80_62660 [Desulfobacteraceae bacterium IS3]